MAGPIFFGIFTVLFFLGAWGMWPPGLLAGPLSEIAGDTALRALGALAMAGIGLEFLGAFVVSLVADD